MYFEVRIEKEKKIVEDVGDLLSCFLFVCVFFSFFFLFFGFYQVLTAV